MIINHIIRHRQSQMCRYVCSANVLSFAMWKLENSPEALSLRLINMQLVVAKGNSVPEYGVSNSIKNVQLNRPLIALH